MTDGAHLGISASRALNTILGGASSPTEEERKSQEDFAAWVYSAPFALDNIGGDDPYAEASRWLARRFLFIMEQAPAIDRDTAQEVFRTMWPEDAKEAKLMTGFMHGWAWNAARHVLSRLPQPNPAILTIDLRKPPFHVALWHKAKQAWAKRYDWLDIAKKDQLE